MSERIIHRIDRIRRHYKLSYNAFDNLFGFSNGYIGGQIRNERNVGADVIEKISSYFTEVNPQWFLTGKGEMLDSESGHANEPTSSYKSIDKLIDDKIEHKLQILMDNHNRAIKSITRKINQIQRKSKKK